MELYQYAPLHKDGAQIRLLTLLSGNFPDELHVVLSNAQFSSSQPSDTAHQSTTPQGNPQDIADGTYTAVSYVWGSEENPSHVVVQEELGSKIIPVTRNLDIALRHLRDHDRERVLWVDAICINQGDLAERSSQVSLMARIYTLARQVVIWLGPEQDDGEYALGLLDTWGSKIEVDWTTMTMAPTEAAGAETYWADSTHPKTLGERESRALFHLWNRQWFERLWVKQEALTAAATTMKCGNAEYPTPSLKNAMFMLYASSLALELPPDDVVRFLDRRRLIYDLVVSYATTRTLERLRFDLRGLQWGDPVDAIYASLSLLTPFEQTLGIVPDYTLSPATVFQDVATRLFDRAGTLPFLPSCELASKSIPELPTWVPDWSSQINVSMVYSYWCASAWIAAQASIESGNILKATGIRKAAVKDVHVLDATSGNGAAPVVNTVQTIYNLLPDDLAQPYVGGGDMCEAYTQTFSADYFADRFMENRRLATLDEAKTFIRRLKDLSNISEIGDFLDIHYVNEMRTYLAAAMTLFTGRCFFTTHEGYIGLAPRNAKPDDSICIILGCRVPMLLRAFEGADSPQWQMVGACYIPGLMSGEAIYGDLSAHLTPFQYALKINLYKLALKDKNTGAQETDSHQILEGFGIPVAKVENDPYRLEVTPEALKEKGIRLETFEVI
ncbi:hypothetical protein SCUP515_12527 [Seiridium cupressi]